MNHTLLSDLCHLELPEIITVINKTSQTSDLSPPLDPVMVKRIVAVGAKKPQEGFPSQPIIIIGLFNGLPDNIWSSRDRKYKGPK